MEQTYPLPPAAAVALDLCHRMVRAVRAGDDARRDQLMAAIKVLEEEFPEAKAALALPEKAADVP